MKTNKEPELKVGVDVSKDSLHAYIDGATHEFKNDKTGIQKLIKKALKINKSCHFVCESTGGYEDLLIGSLLEKNIPVSQVNPTFIKSFIKSFGKHAKTDKIDCFYITKFAQERTLATLDKQWIKVKERREIQQFIDQLIKVKTQYAGNLDKFDDKSLKADLKKQMATNDKLIIKYRKKLKDLITEDEVLAKTKKVLESVCGIGEVTSMALINTLPELGQVNRQEIATLVGIAPMHRESGKYQGQRKIYGGRARPRTALYLATVSAIRHNPEIRTFHERLKSKGKKGKVAHVAASRKLLVYINSLLKKEIYGI